LALPRTACQDVLAPPGRCFDSLSSHIVIYRWPSLPEGHSEQAFNRPVAPLKHHAACIQRWSSFGGLNGGSSLCGTIQDLIVQLAIRRKHLRGNIKRSKAPSAQPRGINFAFLTPNNPPRLANAGAHLRGKNTSHNRGRAAGSLRTSTRPRSDKPARLTFRLNAHTGARSMRRRGETRFNVGRVLVLDNPLL